MNDQTKKPNKSYTSEFKESAVKLANETDQPRFSDCQGARC
ncbi:hypothetical protein [sulfur-oxidizing endosymbiont of Gigantopelta aegis]|nr:hypothetical protein [sulfur-oxidizing endosymbiont of Gigantopelta aegis]